VVKTRDSDGIFQKYFIVFWFEKPQRSQRTQRKTTKLCALGVLCG
jgi:hypothetical protein